MQGVYAKSLFHLLPPDSTTSPDSWDSSLVSFGLRVQSMMSAYNSTVITDFKAQQTLQMLDTV